MIKFIFALIITLCKGSDTSRNKVNRKLQKMNEEYGNWFKIY